MRHKDLHKAIENASNVVGKTWPLYSFVTSNPLSGYESMHFDSAVDHASKFLGANIYPSASVFEDALNSKNIDREILIKLLQDSHLYESPEEYLNLILAEKKITVKNEFADLDRLTTKWLSAFLDEGLAEWRMPNKDQGFFKAWKQLAKYDKDSKTFFKADIPETSEETLITILSSYSESEMTSIMTTHLAALPGWVGYIKHRSETESEWQKAYPIHLIDYLAVRLWMAQHLNLLKLNRSSEEREANNLNTIKNIFLKAWEMTWQKSMINHLEESTRGISNLKAENPDAQMVFCIDTRSELIRRHVENNGNIETFGYAGFFGIATDYEDLETGIVRKSCPPILPSSFITSETANEHNSEDIKSFRKKVEAKSFKTYLLKRLKNMLPSAFGFVEGTGAFYGISMLTRTLFPSKNTSIETSKKPELEHICQPTLHAASGNDSNISVNEKASIVKSAFDLLGWTHFAPIVVFAGHGSSTANNPFASSLDCGACAASPGRHNARLLAKLANDSNVRTVLSVEHNIDIPDGTVFIGAEHNTTTDEIVLFDTNVPNRHKHLVEKLKVNLNNAQKSATQERLALDSNSINAAIKKSRNWSETRPEWGLAKNAGFIIGSRKLTKGTNLKSRCFLHSYEWQKDPEGKALEGIMQGPMVVTQWINNHYYFSTVDNNTLGGGNKISHNVIGKFGVVQGNGGDLKIGLPLQSVNATDSETYHEPLRLSVMIHAPLDRVSTILINNKHLKDLLDNEWIHLLVMNPLENDTIYKYRRNLNWSIEKLKYDIEPQTQGKPELEEALY